MPRVFNEKTTDRVVATADERSSAVIARTALRRVMSESESLYTKPYLTQWVQGKINAFKENLRAQIEQAKNSTKKRDTHFPELYANMLREELEYIELCIEYNDKVPTTVSEDGFLVEKIVEEKVEEFDNNETKKFRTKEEYFGPSEPTRKIDLNTPDSKPEWDKKK